MSKREVTLNKMDMRRVKIPEKDMQRFVLFASNKSGVEREVATKDFLLKNNSYNPGMFVLINPRHNSQLRYNIAISNNRNIS